MAGYQSSQRLAPQAVAQQPSGGGLISGAMAPKVNQPAAQAPQVQNSVLPVGVARRAAQLMSSNGTNPQKPANAGIARMMQPVRDALAKPKATPAAKQQNGLSRLLNPIRNAQASQAKPAKLP